MPNAFDPKNLKHAATLETSGTLFALCRNESIVFGAGTDGSVYRVDLNGKQPKPEKRWTHHENYVSSLEWYDEVVISAGFDRRIVWTDAETGKRIRAAEDAHDGWVRDVVAFPKGNKIASVGDDMCVKLWDTQSARLLQTLKGHQKQTPQGYANALYALAVSPDGQTLASGDRIGHVCLWNVASGKLLQRLEASEFYTYDPVKRVRSIGGIRSLSFSPDGKRLAISGIGQVTNVDGFVGPCRVEVWDWRNGKRTFTGQDSHKAVLNHVAFDATGRWLITGGGGDSGGILAIWNDKAQGKGPVHRSKPKGHLHRFCVRDDGTIITAGYGGFQIWHVGHANR